jgi:hypothetical protein
MDAPQLIMNPTLEPNAAWDAELDKHILFQISQHKTLQGYNYNPNDKQQTELFEKLIELEFGQYMRIYKDADIANILAQVAHQKQSIAERMSPKQKAPAELSATDAATLAQSLERTRQSIAKTMPSEQDLSAIKENQTHCPQLLYSTLCRLKFNTLDTLRCHQSLCQRVIVKEHGKQVVTTNPRFYAKQRDLDHDVKDDHHLFFLGHYTDRLSDNQRDIWLYSPISYVDHCEVQFDPDEDMDTLMCPMTLARLNIFVQLEVLDPELLDMSHNMPTKYYMRDILCVEEGVATCNSAGIYELIYPMSAVRLVYYDCVKQVQQELAHKSSMASEILNRTTTTKCKGTSIKASLPRSEDSSRQPCATTNLTSQP